MKKDSATVHKEGRQCLYNVILRRVRLTILASVIQHAKRMRSILLSSVACQPLPCTSTLSHKRHDFREDVFELLNVKCVFSVSLQIFPATFLISRRIQRDIFINVNRSSCEVGLSAVIARF